MAYRFLDTPEGKGMFKVTFTYAHKTRPVSRDKSYVTFADGHKERLTPKTYRNKAERKAWKRMNKGGLVANLAMAS